MDTKKYTIIIDGVKEAIENVKTLKDVIEGVDSTVKANIQTETSAAQAKKKTATATDELGKAQTKLNSFDAEYAKEVAKVKAELRDKNDAIKNSLKQESDLQIIEAASTNTYKEKQTYLSALNRTIRNMTDAETINGKTKKDLIEISAEVQQSLKDEDEQMKIYVRNVGNYKSATEELVQPTMSLKAELKSLKGELAKLLLEGVSPTDEAFLAMAKRAGEIKDAIGDAGAEISHFASDTNAMDNVINVLTTITASYGLAESAMQAFGIENEAVVESIRRLEAAQTALNSLNALSASLLDNSTMSYKLYHTALQAVGLEKKVSVAATTALTTAETAETAAAEAGTVANTSLAASLWAILSPLLVITATVAVVVGAIYALGEAYKALFGPTDEETAAMEAQNQMIENLNAKTQQRIKLLEQQATVEAEKLSKTLTFYKENLKAVEEWVEKCKEYYGEDSEEYKKAIEKKKEAEKEFRDQQADSLAYIQKKIKQYRNTELKNKLGEVKYKKKLAYDEYVYQIKLINQLRAQRAISHSEMLKQAAELKAAYFSNLDEIDKEAKKTSKSSSSSTKKSSSTSDAEKAAKEFKKAAEELAKAIADMEKETAKQLIDQRQKALDEAKALSKEIKVVDDDSLKKKINSLRANLTEELNIQRANNSLELKELDTKYAEMQTKYSKHTELMKKAEDQYQTQRQIIINKGNKEVEKLIDEANKVEESVNKEYNISKYQEELDYFDKALAEHGRLIDSYNNAILKNGENSLETLQEIYEEMIPIFYKTSEASNVWKEFWELPPDVDKTFDKIKEGKNIFVEVSDGLWEAKSEYETFVDFLKKESQDALDFMMQANQDNYYGLANNLTDYQKAIITYYSNSIDSILTLGNKMKAEGKEQEEIITAQQEAYVKLVNTMGQYKANLIEVGKAVGDVKQEFNAFGEVVDTVPSDGLSKSEKQAKKWGTSMKKFLKKYVDPFKETFNSMGDAINSVFDAINAWLDVDLQRVSDALDKVTEKYEDLSDAVSDTESTLSSLKEEFKSSSTANKTVLAQKIADEEVLLAQEKAAQQEAFNEQQELDEQKEELEKEQAKRQLDQQTVAAGISLINALINTAAGMSVEYSKGILGIPTATLIGILGGIQVAAITAQIAALQAQKSQYAEGGYVNDDGMLVGNRHSEGGIDIKVGKKGRVIEAEGGEFIINRKSSAKYYDLLTEINDYGKTGRTITGLNRQKFANGGSLNFESVTKSFQNKDGERQMERVMENITITPKVSVVDIIKKTNEYNRVRTYAGR